MSNNNFIKNQNRVVKSGRNGSKLLAFIIIVIVSLSAVLSAVFSGLLYFREKQVKIASADILYPVSVEFCSQRYLTPVSLCSTNFENLSYAWGLFGSSGPTDLDVNGNTSVWLTPSTSLMAGAPALAGISFRFYKTSESEVADTFAYSFCLYDGTNLNFPCVKTFSAYLAPVNLLNYDSNGTVLNEVSGNRSADVFVECVSGVYSSFYIGNGLKSMQIPVSPYCIIGGVLFDKGFDPATVYRMSSNVAFRNGSTSDTYGAHTFTFYSADNKTCQFRMYFKYSSNTLQSLIDNKFLNYNVYNDLQGSDEYDRGYSYGYESGYNKGNYDGEQSGFTKGYNQGKSVGFNDGVESANDYSFLGLMGAVVDAPVRAFSGLLNFELLGFNMLSFFTGLLTLAFILWIVSKILGGK